MTSHRHAPPLPAFLRPSGDSSSTSLRHPSGDADALRVVSPSELCSARQTTLAGQCRLLGRSHTRRVVSPPRRFCQLTLTRVPEGFCTESQPCRRHGPFSGPSRRPCSPGRSSPPWCSPSLPGTSFTEVHPLLAFSSSPRPVLQRLPASPSASPARASTDHPGVLGHPVRRFRSALAWLRFASHITWTRAGQARWSGRRKARRRNVSFEGLSSPVVGSPCGQRLSRSWPDLRRLRCGCSRLLGLPAPSSACGALEVFQSASVLRPP